MMQVHVGTFTAWGDAASEGIYCFRCDAETGALERMGTAALENPSILAVSTTRRMLYAVTHTSHFADAPGAGLVAYAIEPSGELRRLGDQRIPSPHPASVALDQAERHVLAASGLGGAASVLPIGCDGVPRPPTAVVQLEGRPSVPLGQASQLPMRLAPGAPHPHCILPSPDDRFVVVTNLGHGRVHVFAFDADAGSLTPHVDLAVSGARHAAFHPGGTTLYVDDEGASAVHVLDWDAAAGSLRHRQTIATVPPAAAAGNTAADLHVHPSGRFVYASNRGHDSIAAFAVGADGELTALGQTATGKDPRGFAIAPDGRLLLAANQGSDDVTAYRLDPDTGLPEPTGAWTSVPSPACVRFADG